MARPRIFISSTFYDLKHVRSSLETFIATLGFEPVLSEKGSIAYSPDVALDESCYREAKACDIFVLIVGGRYGTEAGAIVPKESKGFYERYESITRKEYESAAERGIPVYVLIEKAIYSEYETFKRNRDNQTIKYAHVDSVNVFGFIDFILSRPRNNPVYHFELSTEIGSWLREQWAGLFRELIRARTDQSQMASLAEQVVDLSNVSATLKRYLEEVVERVLGDAKQAKEIINEEEAKLTSSRLAAELIKLGPIRELEKFGVSTEEARKIFSVATSLEDLARRIGAATAAAPAGIEPLMADRVIEHWRDTHEPVENMNKVRTMLGLNALEFEGSESKVEPEKVSKQRKIKQNK